MKRTTGTVWIEKHEHFPKQTFRNRCVIHAPNGPLKLSIPIRKGSGEHTKMKDVKISYDADWQRQHWMSLQTAYRSSPYFEYYEDMLGPYYHARETFLFDFNQKLLQLIMKLLKIQVKVVYTETYEETPAVLADYRKILHPKKPVPVESVPYYQVFEQRNGFIPNLSIIDLLCSQGPRSSEFL